MNQQRIRKIVFSAMFCALVFAATWIYVPAPAVGNVNLGDGVLLLSAWMLGGPWAAVSAALGATLADLSSGFAIYAPATFLIKAAMVCTALLVCRLLSQTKLPKRLARVFSAVTAELVMILGYLAYEALFLHYGIAAIANIPFNAVQGAFAVILSSVVYELLSRIGFNRFH